MNARQVADWCGGQVLGRLGSETNPLRVCKPSEFMLNIGDYVVKRKNDGFVPFTPEDFQDTYVRVDW